LGWCLVIIYVLNKSNLEFLGITTNYVISDLRASITIRCFYEKNKIAVITGASRPLGTNRELLIYGHSFFEQSYLKKAFDLKKIKKRARKYF